VGNRAAAHLLACARDQADKGAAAKRIGSGRERTGTRELELHARASAAHLRSHARAQRAAGPNSHNARSGRRKRNEPALSTRRSGARICDTARDAGPPSCRGNPSSLGDASADCSQDRSLDRSGRSPLTSAGPPHARINPKPRRQQPSARAPPV
jgi:hypothetical protein